MDDNSRTTTGLMSDQTKLASKGQIIFYKGIILEQIHNKLAHDKTVISLSDLEDLLKSRYNILGTSVMDLTFESMVEYTESCKQFASSINLDIDENNGIKLNWDGTQ